MGPYQGHRPDLRQLMAAMTVDAAERVLDGSLLSGNTSDRAWHPEGLDQLDSDYAEDFWKGSYYIADSALMAEPALTKISAFGMHWLDRLPATFSLCDQLKDHAWSREEAWIEMGVLAAKGRAPSATYRAQTIECGGPLRQVAHHRIRSITGIFGDYQWDRPYLVCPKGHGSEARMTGCGSWGPIKLRPKLVATLTRSAIELPFDQVPDAVAQTVIQVAQCENTPAPSMPGLSTLLIALDGAMINTKRWWDDHRGWHKGKVGVCARHFQRELTIDVSYDSIHWTNGTSR